MQLLYVLRGLQVFLDTEGCVVVSFHRAAAACEGDVGAYMAHQADQGGIMQEYRWGQAAAASVLLIQSMWPELLELVKICSCKPEAGYLGRTATALG